ncbi:MAG: hypothetical protein CSB34_01675 [Desulfobulbus propionicus]|nr:MAG: hypothetical protein CSB34_01675 [Desulfobulbus propionicus]
MPAQLGLFNRIIALGKHVIAVFLSRETPLYVKCILGAGLVYVLSPYDLIPEWIPVVGMLDDVALAVLLIAWAQSFQLPKD